MLKLQKQVVTSVSQERDTSIFHLALKMEVTCTSQKLVLIYQTPCCYTQKTKIKILTAMRTSYKKGMYIYVVMLPIIYSPSSSFE
jgi:hypothetical protein